MKKRGKSPQTSERKGKKTPQTQSFTNPTNRPVPKSPLDDDSHGSEKTKSSSSFHYPSLTVEQDNAQSGLFHLCSRTQHQWCQLTICCAPATQLLDRAVLWGQDKIMRRVGKRGRLGAVQTLLSNRQNTGVLSTLV